MGMFDSFFVWIKCPKCGIEGYTVFQTKDFECELKKWIEGDWFESSEMEIESGVIKNIYTYCGSYWSKKEDIDVWAKHKETKECNVQIIGDIVIRNGQVIGIKNLRIKGDI